MILERIVFNILAFGLFLIIFLKMIQKNDTNYIYILVMQALGIAIEFITLFFNIDMPIVLLIITYVISVAIPMLIIYLEKKGILFSEIVSLSIVKIALNLGNQEKAKKVLMKLIQKYPDSYYAHKELAEIYEKENNLETAIEEYIRAVNAHIHDYDSYYKIANLLNKTNKKDESVSVLHDLLKRKPDSYEASILLGDILHEQEKFKEAINVYFDALKYKPDDYDLHYNLGMVFTMLNDFQSAKEYYEKAAQLNSELYNAKFNLGQIALICDEIDEAEAYFMECINVKELEENAYYYLAYIAMLKGEKQTAISYLNIAVEENPDIYNRVKKEMIFKLIIGKIERPKNSTKEGKELRGKRKLTSKEKSTIKHLQRTYELVGNLNHNDIKVMESIKTKKKEESGRERE